MLYIITITDETMNETREIRTDADSVKHAHESAAAYVRDGESVRVYPDTATDDGAARAALLVATVTARNSVKRTGGNETQWKTRNELVSLSARVELATETEGNALDVAEHINGELCGLSHDAQDMYSAAMDGIMYGADVRKDGEMLHLRGALCGGGAVESVRAGYAAANAYVHALRGASVNECSMEYITDGNGDIVMINTAIAQILRGGERWTPTDGGEMDASTAARLGAALHGAMRVLSPTQARIVVYMGRGYSQREIARRVGKQVQTVEKHIANIRAKFAEYIAANAAEFAPMIDGAASAASAAKWANECRTESGKARHAEQMKATQAERARRYRERKKAAAMAARNGGK